MLKTIFVVCICFFINTLPIRAQTWQEQNSGTTQTLTSVSAYSVYTAWVCGYGGTVLRTINAGTNWQNVSGNGISPATQLINIAAVDANVAVTAGYVGSNTFVYRTSNGGANWSQVFSETNGFIDAICFKFNSGVGFMVGDPVGGRWSLWRTTNEGINWDSSGMYLPQSGTEAGWNNSAYCLENRIWFGTNNTRIYYSSDFGTSWMIQPTASELNSYAVWFEMFGDDGLAGGATFLKTTNYGTNWNLQAASGTGNIGGIAGGYIITDNPFFHTYYVRGSNQIFGTTNNGTSWDPQYTTASGTYRHIAIGRFGSGCWAVRDNGGITFNVIFSGVSQNGNGIPDEFELNQNYPNPFNPVTHMEFAIPSLGFVSLKVFDISGAEIVTLVNEKLSPGNYKFEFDGRNYASGVYLYKLTTNNFSETKRMILLK